MSNRVIDTEKFWTDGYLEIKDIFTPEEIETFRVKAIKENEEGNTQSELLSKKDEIFSNLIKNKKIVNVAHALLGEKPVYFGDSSITYGTHHRGWHKDNRFPDRFKHNHSDWVGRYTMLRFGIYLQDHTYYSGGLGIRIKSHYPSRLVNILERLHIPFLNPKYNNRIKTRLQIWASGLYGKAKLLNSKPGDLLVWNQTTTHSGNALRLKMAPNFKLPTFVENNIPSFLVRPYQDDRIAIFIAYACRDEHLKRGLEFLKTRDYMVNKWDIYKNTIYKSTNELDIMNYEDIYS